VQQPDGRFDRALRPCRRSLCLEDTQGEMYAGMTVELIARTTMQANLFSLR